MKTPELVGPVLVLALLVMADSAVAISLSVPIDVTAGRVSGEPAQPTELLCPALPQPSESIISVSSFSEVWNAVNGATGGTTILVADDA